tara:strand:+ start:225 stop:566 length:342 start_codon:yes stop_codon:yes gene_type:complete
VVQLDRLALLELLVRQVPLVLRVLKALLDLKAQQVRLVLRQQWQLGRLRLELLDLAQRFQTVALQVLLSWTSLFRRVLLVLKVLLVRKARPALRALQGLRVQQAAFLLVLSRR